MVVGTVPAKPRPGRGELAANQGRQDVDDGVREGADPERTRPLSVPSPEGDGRDEHEQGGTTGTAVRSPLTTAARITPSYSPEARYRSP